MAAGWLAAIAFLIVALAGPRWGKGSNTPLPAGHDVVFLVDVSRSMGAEDALPDRLGVAIASAESLLGTLARKEGERVAVVAFSGRGVLRCPLTWDLDAAGDALRSLRPGILKPGGTDLGAALEAAREAFNADDRSGGRTIVLFSDGEDLVASWRPVLRGLREQGIIVHTIAVGGADRGQVVPSGRGPASLSYRGAIVLSKRDDGVLRAVANSSGGVFVPLGLAPADLGGLYRDRIEPIERRNREAIVRPEPGERYAIFVLASLGCILAASWPRRAYRAHSRGWILAVSLVATLAAGPGGRSADEWIALGRAAYAGKRFDVALAGFEHAIAEDPREAIPRYDAGAALFQLGRYPEARIQYLAARRSAGASLRMKIDYALGNTALASGDVPAALDHYSDCLAATMPGAALEAVRRDATANRRYAEALSRRLTAPSAVAGGKSPGSNRPNNARTELQPPRKTDGSAGSEARGQPSGAGGQGLPQSGLHRTGGAGGPGSSRSGSGSPLERLAAALEHIREARRQRLEDPVPAPDLERKDW